MPIIHFPIELLKLITVELSDKDLCSFTLACRTFHDAVQGDQTVWRSRFLKTFDNPAKSRRAGYNWRKTYQDRQRLSLQGLEHLRFLTGNSEKEVEALEILLELLLDARGHLDLGAQTIEGSNFKHIRAATLPRSLFSLCDKPANHLLHTINLLLTPLSGTPETGQIPNIQTIVYNPIAEPTITTDGFPNVEALAPLAQFFIYHIHPLSESLVFHQKTLLQPNEFPSFWEGGLMDEESGIPTKWFGAYTYLNHPRALTFYRSLSHLPDRSDDYLADMTLSFSSPAPFPSHTTECGFTGTGRDFIDFIVRSGKLTRLPSPPGVTAVPGWKKVQFIKDYRSHSWAYEGVMLPGNNMILGHWRSSFDNEFAGQSGPFIFWAAPEASSLVSRDNRLSR